MRTARRAGRASGTGVRGRVLDAALAAAVLVVGTVEAGDPSYTPGPASVHVASFVVLGAAVLWRRTRPGAAFVVSSVVLALTWLAVGAPENSALVLGMTVLLYSVGRWEPRRRLALLCLVLSVGLAAMHLWRDPLVRTPEDLRGALIFEVVAPSAWLVGFSLRSRAGQRRAEAGRIAAGERSRIARDLHDVVAHGVSVMVVQAEAAAAVARSDPARAEEAMDRVAQTGRVALSELRAALGVLADPTVAVPTRPPPGLAALDDLVAAVRQTGLDVEPRVATDGPPLPPGVDLTVYRIVQEGLTNVVRHAGAGRAWVRVTREASAVLVEVADDGAGSGGSGLAGAGSGLGGLAERVSALGGTLEAGPAGDRGWSVRARLPVEAGP